MLNKMSKIGVILLITCLLGLFATSVSAKPQWITELTLQYTTDWFGSSTWSDVGGALSPGFVLKLDPTVQFFYIDIKTISPIPDLGGSATKDYPFYLKTHPDGYFEYWATKGVTAGATYPPLVELWKIINGVEPMFWLHAQDDGVCFLFDGFLLWMGIPRAVRVNGDYLLGTYHFIGHPVVGGQATSTMIKITFK